MKGIPEFKIGDEVTFDSYGTHIPAKVVEIQKPYNPWVPDARIGYKLTGVDTKKPLVTLCTGNSIVESKLFRSYPKLRCKVITKKRRSID